MSLFKMFVAGVRSGVVFRALGFHGVFELHIAKFFSIENFATVKALDKFRVFVPGNYAYFGMFAGGCHHYSGAGATFLFRPDCSDLAANFK
ncbi:MAG: hypothetical protein P4K83_06205 [Terracidiphilus sp.]|nr:hypothetical protein [Terracidiphilus sp.]